MFIVRKQHFGLNGKGLWPVYEFYEDSDNLKISTLTFHNLTIKVFNNKPGKLSFIGYMGIK